MLTSLRIQNFRSIRDASVKLGQVNLFIGPNNSGKSNFLKGIELTAKLLSNKNKNGRAGRDNLPKDLQHASYDAPATMTFTTVAALKNGIEAAVITSLTDDVLSQSVFIQKPPFKFPNFLDPQDTEYESHTLPDDVRRIVQNTIIYDINPERLRGTASLKNVNDLTSDGTDLVLFLFSLSQNNRLAHKRLETDLQACIHDLVAVSTPADPDKPGDLRIRFYDHKGVKYWAEEVSEGVLYFLALLCIIHQPDPPKLLLLEEPEKGIHPRRIREVMDFIFELARLRDIQIILTSHSPYVVDHFADIPECISIFDRDPETGETLIRNAEEHIEQTNAELVEKGFAPIAYTDALGEYWVSGFLGGVPLNNL